MSDKIYGTAAEFLHNAGLVDNLHVSTSDNLPLYFFEFVVTPSCNLGCSYCFANAAPVASSAGADLELCELFIDRIAEYRAQTQATVPFVIEFTGGEPLLNFSAISHTVTYAQSQYGDLLNADFCLQSNLTHLTDEIIRFSSENKIYIGVSCDGYSSIHDVQRPLASGKGSHRLVEHNLQRLIHQAPKNVGGIICVITPENAQLIPELMLYFACLGCSQLVFRPMEVIGRGSKCTSPAEAYVDGLFDGLASVITPLYNATGHVVHEQYLALTFEHLFRSGHPFMCERSPCGAAKNICAVSSKGEVYSCHQASGNQHFHLGSLYDKTFSELLKAPVARALQARNTKNICDCAKCAYRAWCASPCAVSALSSHGTVMAATADCKIVQYRYERALKGLIDNELDMDVISAMVGSDMAIKWHSADLTM